MEYDDVSGDANAVNTQGERGFGHGGDVSTGPVTAASADITRVAFKRWVKRGNVRGYTVTVSVAGPVTDGTMFSVFAVTEDCDPVTVQHVRTAEGETLTELRAGCAGSPRTSRTLPPAIVRGSRVTIRVPLSALPTQVRMGTVLGEIYAYTVAVGPNVKPFLHAPKLDIAATRDTYRIGS